MDRWHLGVIGGSGLYDLPDLEDVQTIDVKSPFGDPSGPVTLGRIGDVRLAFLARHGAGHAIAPSQVNYRANVDVLKRCGVTDLVAVSAVGSLEDGIAPGSFVAVDQMIDRTSGRRNTFYDSGIVAHVSLADPTCPQLRASVAAAAAQAGAEVRDGGCYVAIEGPQFSTRAESRLYRQWGGDVIGMTGMPEARLAREAELPYALLGMVTDYDSWRDDQPGVDAAEVLSVMSNNAELARQTIVAMANALPSARPANPIDTVLDSAIVTADAEQDDAHWLKLDAVAKRFVQARAK